MANDGNEPNKVRGLTVYSLASIAHCGSPDSSSSPGALFLYDVAEAVAESIEEGDWGDDEPARIADEAAYSAEARGTHKKWRIFIDLAAYQEDPSELGADASDMSKAADVCLYMIAERLAFALAERWADESGADEESEG